MVITNIVDNITVFCYTILGDAMRGIDLNKPITYQYASMRYFSPGERHITRFCMHDVLLMVFDGVLRFNEDNTEYEVHAGEYHIQKSNSYQTGYVVSDSPKYLFVHFHGSWQDDGPVLPFRGTFDSARLKDHMEDLDLLSHTNSSLLSKTAKFLALLEQLIHKDSVPTLADQIAQYIQMEDLQTVSLEKTCHYFNFSKNHIINTLKKQYGVTPVEYIHRVKIERAKYLLEVTSDSTEHIASECGFNDYSHFYKVFTRMTGVSPTAFRKSKQIVHTIL